MDNGVFDLSTLPGSDILNNIGKQMQDAFDKGTRALTGGRTLSEIGTSITDPIAKPIDNAAKSVADQIGGAVQGVVDGLTAKLGPAFARVALALLALVLVAAAFWLLSNSRKVQMVST